MDGQRRSSTLLDSPLLLDDVLLQEHQRLLDHREHLGLVLQGRWLHVLLGPGLEVGARTHGWWHCHLLGNHGHLGVPSEQGLEPVQYHLGHLEPPRVDLRLHRPLPQDCRHDIHEVRNHRHGAWRSALLRDRPEGFPGVEGPLGRCSGDGLHRQEGDGLVHLCRRAWRGVHSMGVGRPGPGNRSSHGDFRACADRHHDLVCLADLLPLRRLDLRDIPRAVDRRYG
mmetsp:Transcript_8244/g.30122  ORF Transcript_8244/g.30122 Transcript_8244/m.30122 type:complete len:225 (+) Transcript_8244:936-1610(+)